LDTVLDMARTVQDASLGTRTARLQLKVRGKPYYREIEPGLHLGYRRLGDQQAGTWMVRRYVGHQQYAVAKIGAADDYSDADGVELLSFKQAQDKARTERAERVQAEKASKGPLTVRQAIDDYVAYLEHERRSARDARYKANALILPALGETEIAKLATKQVRDWLAGVAKAPPRLRTKPGGVQKWGPQAHDEESRRRRRSTANRVLTILKAALNRQFADGHVLSDAAWRRVKPYKGADAARVRYLTLAEAKRLVNVCDPDFRPLVTAALMSGCRYGELTRLETSDFNRDSETLHVRMSKSGKAKHVELTTEAVRFFAAQCAGRVGLMFPREDGEPWGDSHQQRRMADACRIAKIKPRISFHGLRHTWASNAVMNGVPLLVVAKNLGHKDTRMVEKHYGHLAPSYVREAIRKNAPTFGFRVRGNVAELTARRAGGAGR
jgi:integrase